MSYEKNTWQTGDTITAQKLNNIETGIEDNNNNIIICTLVNAETEIDYQRRLTLTFKQIQEALEANKMIILKFTQAEDESYISTQIYFINQFDTSDDSYFVSFEGLGWSFSASTDINSYPLESID